MQTIIGQGKTRDGRAVTIRRVVGPDEEWAGRIMPFLGHKGSLWQWQLEQLLKSKFEGLDFCSYLADVEGQGAELGQGQGQDVGHGLGLGLGRGTIAGNICTIESQGVGLFGHVYTAPAYRGQSLARILTEACVNDFAARGGLALWLTTDFESTAHRAYQQFGFEPITPGDGIMAWWAAAGQAEVERRFAPGQATRVRPTAWPDYATLNALACEPAGPPQRSTALDLIGRNIVEFTYLRLLREMTHSPDIQAQVLVAERDWPVGLAVLTPDLRGLAPLQEKIRPLVLDLYAHPNFESDYPRLLASLSLPADRKIIAVIDSLCPAREAALAGAGFVTEGRLTRLFPWHGRMVDRVYMARDPG